MAIDVEAAGSDLDLLFRAHYTSLLRCVRLLVDDPADAEDLVQETFVRAHRARADLADQASEAAYLRSTVLNLARSRLRHLRVVRRHRGEPPSFVDTHNAERPAVLAALRNLSSRQRECVVLRYYLELSEQEIAATLGISRGSVKTHSSRALAALAPVLEALR